MSGSNFVAPLELKFASDGAGEFEGYGAVFGNVDSHGDLIAPGAFATSLAEHKSQGSMPAMYVQHGPALGGDSLPAGVWTDVEEDARGLKVKGKISALDTDYGRRLRSLMQDGAMKGLSIGYRVATGGATLGKKAGEAKSAGYKFIESEEYKAAADKFGDTWRGSMSVEVKAITSASATGVSTSTALVPSDRVAGIIDPPRRPLTVRDLLTPGRTTSGSIEYGRENVFTNNAAAVAENPSAVKPESNITYELVSTGVKTIAHWVPASKQILADAPQLQSIIDGRLRYGLAFKEDEQLLLGDGTGVNLLGLMPQASAYSAPAGITVASETRIDRMRLAMLQATLALYPSTGHVLHPTDWAAIELTKDAGGNYIWANPANLVGPTLWGLPVAQSLAMPVGQFLTGALKYAAQIFDREDANVLISTEDRDNFVKNMVTILCEERLALAVYRRQALVKGTFA